MGGVTVAPQLAKNNNDNFLAAFNANTTQLDTTSSTMDDLLSSTHGWPMEDLTGEVHDLMLRESMTWLPWMDENDESHSVKNTTMSMEGFDSQLLAQTLQLDGLFGQELNFEQFDDTGSSLLYDELTYDPSPVTTPLPTPTEHDPIEEDIRTATVPSVAMATLLSPSQSPSPSSQSPQSPPTPQLPQQENLLASTKASSHNGPDEEVEEDNDDEEDDSTDEDSTDDDSTDDDSDEEADGPVSVMTTTYMYLPKRQVEESLLSKITQHLQPDKLPGILSIVSSVNDDDQKEGEVEIDLSCLVREQLVRVMLYVDACIAEQQGGPAVKVSDYMVKESKKSRSATAATTEKTMRMEDDDDDDDEGDNMTATANNANRKRKRRRASKAAGDDGDKGPISMAALTKKARSRKPSTSNDASTPTTVTSTPLAPAPAKRRRTRKKQKDVSVPVPSNTKKNPNSIASTRPKRRAALHKRRILEEMLLVPSEDDDEVEETMDQQQVMVTYGEEQMDFRVIDNQTIVHQPHSAPVDTPVRLQTVTPVQNEADEEDEEIDIM